MRHECDTSETKATRVRHKCNTSVTRTARVRHECYKNNTSATRVLHERHKCDTSEQILILITIQEKNNPILQMTSESLQEEEQFHSKYYL